MVKDNGGDAVKLAEGTAAVPSAKKDAVIAGAMALRAMLKNGKFAQADDAVTAQLKEQQ
ncbi:Variable outer membrane protein (plasmid) [Borrelia miyamotoi FR64b]|uniref:Variable large protein n=1 Tax=Borrelia miyamotoi FR64b TaxID=1292392 RepID=W5SLF1_9SPIR|nr:Variable outer membrane protein [Borrelia miyamotoi FR64b]